MRMPRFRFTVRGATIALTTVAVVGLAAYLLAPRRLDLRPYQAAVDEIRRHPPAESGYLPGRHCHVELGPPLRVAFPEDGGILDNWNGIVYDPTGLVLKANLLRPDFSNRADPALREVHRMFGGLMTRAVPLGGGWYRCSFT